MQYFCPNEQCKDYGLRRQGNISVRGKYSTRTKAAICCTCGKRFASSATFGLRLPADHHAFEGLLYRSTV